MAFRGEIDWDIHKPLDYTGLFPDGKPAMSNVRDALALLIKSHMVPTPCAKNCLNWIWVFTETLKGWDIPVCEAIGARTNTACGGLFCPRCEFARRWVFGRHLAWMLTYKRYEGPVSVIEHEVRSPHLVSLTDTSPGALHDPSVMRRIRSLDGLIGWMISVEWDHADRSWIMKRTAVARSEPKSFRMGANTANISVRTMADYSGCEEASLNASVGEYAALVLPVMLTGNTLLSILKEDDDGEFPALDDAAPVFKQWAESSMRLHLMRCVGEQRRDEVQCATEAGF